MTSAHLRAAIEEAQLLTEEDQDEVARRLSLYLTHLRALRSKLQAGISSLDAGQGKELDIEEVIRSAQAKYG